MNLRQQVHLAGIWKQLVYVTVVNNLKRWADLTSLNLRW